MVGEESIWMIIAGVIAAILMIAYYLLRGKPVTRPSITLATDKSSYGTGETVTLSGAVSEGGNPKPNASVSITISPPSGDAYSLSGTTDASGGFQVTWNVPSDAVEGQYQADAAAVGATATVTFKPRRG